MCMQVAPLAAAFVGYVVFWNLSLQVNSVGFYQLSKIMVLPTVAALEVSPMPCITVTLRSASEVGSRSWHQDRVLSHVGGISMAYVPTIA